MRALIGVAIACCAFFVSACSMTPTLEETTGTNEPPPIFVKDVVQRVKCEIYETALALRTEPKFAWTNDWTAKVNLTLAVSNTAGLTPNVSAVRYLHNGYYNAETSTGNTLLAAVQQKFTFGAAVTLQEAATRSDLVAFTVGFGDITSEQSKERPEDCAIKGSELRGGLGLKEWVLSAFSPVEKGQLLAGKALNPRKYNLALLKQRLCRLIPKNKTLPGCSSIAKGTVAENLEAFWKAAEALNDPCVDEAFLILFKKDLEELREHGKPKKGSVEERLRSHSAAFKATDGGSTACKGMDKLFKEINITKRFDDANTAVQKNLMEAEQYYDANIKPYQQVLQSGKTKEDLRVAKSHLDKMKEFFDSVFFKDYKQIFVSSFQPEDKACHATLEASLAWVEDGGLLTGMEKLVGLGDDLKKIKTLVENRSTAQGSESRNETLLAELKKLEGVVAGIKDGWLLEEIKNMEELVAAKQDEKLPAEIDKIERKWSAQLAVLAAMLECRISYFTLIVSSGGVQAFETFKENVQEIDTYIQSVTPVKPIDSLTHTVTFVATYGGGIQPNWTLIQVNGPLSQLANAQNVRTHTLLIAIGPESENKTNIQNATVTNALGPH